MQAPPQDTKYQVNPPNTGKLGLLLFLAALAMLFIASLLAYALIRYTGQNAPPTGSIHLPGALWISTIAILVSSVTIQHALACVAHEKQLHFKLSMTATVLLATLFLAVQTPSLYLLLQRHHDLAAQNIHLYGLIFLLILLHALHVIGGVIPMLITWIKSLQGRYDHEQHRPVAYLAMYWHFLDAVWLVMFTTLLVLA